MKRGTRYPKEVRERAVHLVFEHELEYDSQRAAIGSIASKLGMTPETLRALFSVPSDPESTSTRCRAASRTPITSYCPCLKSSTQPRAAAALLLLETARALTLLMALKSATNGCSWPNTARRVRLVFRFQAVNSGR
jgi:transposase-like protein